MRTTIDASGRLVIPKALRLEIGIEAGTVEIEVDGSALRIQPIARDDLEERDGFLVIPAGGEPITVEDIRNLRLADQR